MVALPKSKILFAIFCIGMVSATTYNKCGDLKALHNEEACCSASPSRALSKPVFQCTDAVCTSSLQITDGTDTLDVTRQDYTNERIAIGEAAGTVSWFDFNEAQRAEEPVFDNYIVTVTNADFASGTVRLRRPCVLKLMEDVTFNPNANSQANWMPVCFGAGKQVDYCEATSPSPLPGFRLGFFAAITIESPDVIVDLNGFTLAQNEEAALQQRFYANIETAGQPFIPDQGPSLQGFGNMIKSCNRCSIINGVLGRSSHHGIHGNNNTGLFVSNVQFRDYEVAAISINGARHSAIVNSEAKGHFTQIPTRATYSQARFIQHILNGVLFTLPSSAAKTDIQAKLAALDSLLVAARTQILTDVNAWFYDSATDSAALKSAKSLFRLEAKSFTMPDGSTQSLRTVDGNAYGITLSTTGTIVGTFKDFFDQHASNVPSGTLESVLVKNTTIKNVLAAINEVPTIKEVATGKTMVSVAGDALRYTENVNADGTYNPDALSDLQLSVGYWSSADGGNNTHLIQARSQGRLGTMGMNGELGRWARGIQPRLNIPLDYEYVCDTDAMVHANKGVFGLFHQGGRNVVLDGVHIENVQNAAKLSTTLCMPSVEANGANARGFCAKASRGGHVWRSKISNVVSHRATAWGAHLLNDVDGFSFQNVEISNISAKNMGTTDRNFKLKSLGIELGDGVKNFESRSVSTEYIGGM